MHPLLSPIPGWSSCSGAVALLSVCLLTIPRLLWLAYFLAMKAKWCCLLGIIPDCVAWPAFVRLQDAWVLYNSRVFCLGSEYCMLGFLYGPGTVGLWCRRRTEPCDKNSSGAEEPSCRRVVDLLFFLSLISPATFLLPSTLSCNLPVRLRYFWKTAKSFFVFEESQSKIGESERLRLVHFQVSSSVVLGTKNKTASHQWIEMWLTN